MRVNELAKELGIPTPQLMNKLKRLKIKITSAVTVLDDGAIARARKELAAEKKPDKTSVPLKAKKPAASKQKDEGKKVQKPAAKTAKAVKPRKSSTVKSAAPVAPVPPDHPVDSSAAKTDSPKVEPTAKSSSPTDTLPLYDRKPPLPAAAQPPKVSPAAPKFVPRQQFPSRHKGAPGPSVFSSPAKPKVEDISSLCVVKNIEISLPITVKDLAVKLQVKSSVLIKKLMDMKVMATLNQGLPKEVVEGLCKDLGVELTLALEQEEGMLKLHAEKDPPEALKPRPPIVTFMGHVDHGKTSLMDVIRKANVVDSEYGGITQHIGAYQITLPKGKVTFLDTPGHEAFTAMRARGANITDIVVLVVAADDGVMPQTVEAIDHAKAAGVPIIVAVNKMDKPQANPDKVKKQLADLGLTPEDWGGKVIMVGVSAKSGEGVPHLLDMMLLEAEMLELKANPDKRAKGVVIEAKMSKGRGPVATLLVENGTLNLNDSILAGQYCGKVRAMFDDCRRHVQSASPSMPVEVSGLDGLPEAGDEFFVMSEKDARSIAYSRQDKERQTSIIKQKKISLEDVYSQIKEGQIKELRIVLKADVQGSLEAITESLGKVTSSEVQYNIIHSGIGTINYSDAILAAASNALILGFHVKSDAQAEEIINREGIDVRNYTVIYELLEDLKSALEGLLAPKIKRIFLGKAEVKKVFNLSRSGIVCGCVVSKGKVTRSALGVVMRNGANVYEGKITSLKRFKDDVKEVGEGFECGLLVGSSVDYQPGDVIEIYEEQKVGRTL